MTASLVLVRHGQSEWNKKNLFTGWKNPDLTTQGINEATSAGIELKDKDYQFDIMFTSDLLRAQKTGEIILEQLDVKNLPIVKHQALNERNYGDLSGLNKDEARKNTIEALKTLEVKSGVELVVRINCQRTKFGLLDLEAFVSSKMNIKSLMLPKVKTPDEITFIDDLLTDCGLDTNLHVIMETNEALESIYDIAHASKRIVALYFGGVDMAAELRVPNEFENLIYARSKLVHAGASVGVDVVDVPYLDLENMDGMKKEAELVRDLGFTGKGSIHPKQINILNEIIQDIIKLKIKNLSNPKSNEFSNRLKQIVGKSFSEVEFKELISSIFRIEGVPPPK